MARASGADAPEDEEGGARPTEVPDADRYSVSRDGDSRDNGAVPDPALPTSSAKLTACHSSRYNKVGSTVAVPEETAGGAAAAGAAGRRLIALASRSSSSAQGSPGNEAATTRWLLKLDPATSTSLAGRATEEADAKAAESDSAAADEKVPTAAGTRGSLPPVFSIASTAPS